MADIILVGGGVVGGTLACALAEKGLEVILVDQLDPRTPPSMDHRSFALSHSSYVLFSHLGIWQTLEEVTPIRKIHTSDGMLPRWLDYAESDLQCGPLGYVIESACLKSKILEKILSFKNISLHAPMTPKYLERTDTSVKLGLEGGEILKAPLCIAADGKASTLRSWVGIPLLEWAYDQVSIVCHMTHTRPHQNQAFEHFLPLGPLAFVPRMGNESGLVWSVEKEKADVLLNLSPQDFSQEVQAHFGDALGKLTLSSQRWSYLLGVCLPKRLIDQRFALVGDAAHLFHPIAGQGLNVGLRDVAVLAECLGDAFSLGLDVGSEGVLKGYQRQRRLDILSMTFLTDGLVRVFSNQSRSLARLRSLGFGIAKHCPPLKTMMIRHAMGLKY